jgi:hypothetical protein
MDRRRFWIIVSQNPIMLLGGWIKGAKENVRAIIRTRTTWIVIRSYCIIWHKRLTIS